MVACTGLASNSPKELLFLLLLNGERKGYIFILRLSDK